MKALAAAALALACTAGGMTTAHAALRQVQLVCDAVYMPARTSWNRVVDIGYDDKRVRSVSIDGVPVYTFAIAQTVIMTALDNERIQIDTASQTWTSDFRGQATGQGRCERATP